MKRWIAPLLVCLALFGVLVAQQPAAPAVARLRTSTVIVVRHAEKDPQGDPKDPGLSEVGKTRALALAHLLAPAKPTLLVASEFQRTQRTLEPLAVALGLKVEPVPARDGAALAQRLRALPPGSVSVVAGHSNTVPALVEALGARCERIQQGQLGEDEFGRVFVLTLAPSEQAERVATGLVELSYGN